MVEIGLGSKRFKSFKLSNFAECSTAPGNRFYLQQSRFSEPFSKENGISKPFRVDSDDGPFLKKISKCFESIPRKGTSESIRGFQNRFTSVQDLKLTFENYLRVDSFSSESILKEEECHRDDITSAEVTSGGLRADNPTYGNSGLPA
ncbi:hypothetical protein PIB30_059125 [Stylosanthes scabra]|uniref:Uncharacterized protein n=1 Tax=Stylosanthes scabra TaxID=79078 RepID=A0ABU6SK54_9FABA|nr:hypothetical protein [Stylosanthes scabra]